MQDETGTDPDIDRTLFRISPVAMYDEDFSLPYVQLQALRSRGINGLRTYFVQNPK